MKKEEKENLEGEFTVTSECLKEVEFKVRKLKIQDVKAGTVFKLVKTEEKEDWDEDNFKYVRTINFVEDEPQFKSGKCVKLTTTFGSSYIGESDLDYDYFVNTWIGQVCGFPSIEGKLIDFSNLNKIVTPLNPKNKVYPVTNKEEFIALCNCNETLPTKYQLEELTKGITTLIMTYVNSSTYSITCSFLGNTTSIAFKDGIITLPTENVLKALILGDFRAIGSKIEKEPVPTYSLTDVFVKKYKTETWTIDINLITDKEVIAVISSKIKDKYIIPPSTVSYTIKAFEDIIKNYEKHS